MPGSKTYENVTVVAIYGDGRGGTAIPAIRRTVAALPGSKPLLITNVEIDTTYMVQKLIQAPLDYQGYSEFVMYSLHNYIDTEYALIVQHDGWALNPENWRDEWLEYDYVGGPTHAALLPNGEYRLQYTWHGMDNPIIVQNGGFSLRSKRFLEAPSRYGIMRRQMPDPTMMNEDIQLTCILRNKMERLGMKYAPVESAKYFSFEHLGPMHTGMDITKIFGHHSRFRQLLSNGEMLWKLTKEQMKEVYGEPQVYDLFAKHYGYTIHAV